MIIFRIIIASLMLCLSLFHFGGYKNYSGTYTFGEGIESSEVTLNEDGSFEFDFSPLSSYIGFGEFSITGDRLTLETSDGMYRYVFRITDSGIEFDADASSDVLWFGQFTDGSVFLK